MPKVVYADGGNLFIVSKSPSSNKKISLDSRFNTSGPAWSEEVSFQPSK